MREGEDIHQTTLLNLILNRSEFESGSISVVQRANKIAVTVGTGIPSQCYDLYEAKASEGRNELLTILFRLADRVSQLTEQLKGINLNLMEML